MSVMRRAAALLLALLLPLSAARADYWADKEQDLVCKENRAGCHVLQMVMMGCFADMDEDDSLSLRVHAAVLPWLRAITQEDFDHFCAQFGEEEARVQECYLIALGYALWADILVSPEPEEEAARQARRVLLLFMDPDDRWENLSQMAAIRSQMTDADLEAIAAAAQVPTALADRLIYSDHWQQTAE